MPSWVMRVRSMRQRPRMPELVPGNETGGVMRVPFLITSRAEGAGREADPEEAQCLVQGEGGGGGAEGRPDDRRAGAGVRCASEPDPQLEEDPAGRRRGRL